MIIESSLAHLDLDAVAPECKRVFRCVLPLGLTAAAVVRVLVVRGTTRRPVLIATAGVHGDEFEGVAALLDLYEELAPVSLRGTFVALPVCNPFAFEAQQRLVPAYIDGLNLARVFPGTPAGTPTSILAHHLFTFLLRHLGPDGLLVDLHSAGSRDLFLPMVGYRAIPGPARSASEDAARHFGHGRLWEIPDEPGTLTAELARRGTPCIGTEAPGRGGCEATDVKANVASLRRLLRFRGILEGPPPAIERAAARRATLVRVQRDGLLRDAVPLGAAVAEGQQLARVDSLLGEAAKTVTAPHAGHIWGQRGFASIRAGDVAFWLAEPAGSA